MSNKPRMYICGYTFCKHKEDKVSPEYGIKDGTRYFHPECHKEKEKKKQILDLYYKYYHSTEDYRIVTKAINTMINNQGNEASYVLFCLCQCIRDKVPFKSIFTLSWIVKNKMEYRKKYDLLKAKEKTKGFEFENVSCVDSEPKTRKQCPTRKTKWTDVLFGGD